MKITVDKEEVTLKISKALLRYFCVGLGVGAIVGSLITIGIFTMFN